MALTGVCLNCEAEFTYRHSSTGKYCSRDCSTEHRKQEHRSKFWSGLLEKRVDRPTARRYIAERRGYNCEVCGISEWQGKPITLEVDHINGDPSNDHPDNLRIICPNCHQQTEFRGGRNKGRGRGAKGIPLY